MKILKNMRPLKNVYSGLSSRIAKVLTAPVRSAGPTPVPSAGATGQAGQAGIQRLFRGLKFEPDTEIGPKEIFCRGLSILLGLKIYFGRSIASVPDGSIILFPYSNSTLFCGLSGIAAIKNPQKREGAPFNIADFEAACQKIKNHDYLGCIKRSLSIDEYYMGGDDHIDAFHNSVRALKKDNCFYDIYAKGKIQEEIIKIVQVLGDMVKLEEKILADNLGYLDFDVVEKITRRIDELKDILWCLSSEILKNIRKINDLMPDNGILTSQSRLNIFKKINSVMNSIDRLEVRGRDSAGISLMFVFDEPTYQKIMVSIEKSKLTNDLSERMSREVLTNNDISLHTVTNKNKKIRYAISLVYKVAAEVGSLGDNTRFLREQIKGDSILHILADFTTLYHTVLSHTRWASIGSIIEANCHPVDNSAAGDAYQKSGIIHVCLNGDIDNYLELKAAIENDGNHVHEEITTDTKIIPMQVEKYVKQGQTIDEAFRLAVNDFDGSHAISMHTSLAPGKLFLAQKGSGQAVFIGLAAEHYMATSEVYGFVEETSRYVKMDGESTVDGVGGKTQGQIFILDQESDGGVEGIHAMYYDGTVVKLNDSDIKRTEITSRDIDRQNFSHFFLKEISESPLSVEKTMLNRWKIDDSEEKKHSISLDEKVVPGSLKKAIKEKQIKRIFFIGQGTAGVAAAACANLMDYYLNDPSFQLNALKASELSGFKIGERDKSDSMADTLVIAISQSGTTTDTNRTIEMVKDRGAHTLAIVNRRDSDITFKVDGVMYTSSGRDIEMSVASTKAFYSQIIAGAFLGLYIASILKRRDSRFVSEEIKRLLEIPGHMKTILSMMDRIGQSAQKTAVTKTYWATVGSGPNKVAADEIRIKLSELCYKTISSDFVEDKKHIDLSSEPLIIICAAGTRNTVIGDIIKDTAIFKAHKATPIVIADAGDTRFDMYAEDVFHVPAVSEHLAPIMNTLVGHIWGYYAAIAINEGSRFLYLFQEEVRRSIDDSAKMGLDVYEIILERSFREKILNFYNAFRTAKTEKRIPGILGIDASSDLTLLLKYLTGRLPVSDFEIDFGVKGTAINMLEKLFECLGESINMMARPVDAIKHQAKTVTVGTSRLSEKVEGILFDVLEKYRLNVSQLINRNIIVLKNLQTVVSGIKGAIFYRISGLTQLGDFTDETRIEIIEKAGVLKPIPSRIETDTRLTGTKRIIANDGNVYVGKGRKDDRSILVIPLISQSHSTPNVIEYLLLLNISFKSDVSVAQKIKALGGKFEHIKDIVQENNIEWEDELIELVAIDELFGRSAEKIGEFIISSINGNKSQ